MTTVSSIGASARLESEASIRGRPPYGARSFPPPNRLPDPAASRMAEIPLLSGTAPPVCEGQLIVFWRVHVGGQRRIDSDPAHSLRVCLHELPYGLVPVQATQVAEGFPGEDERMPRLPVVCRHAGPRPIPAPSGERGIYELGPHARLVAQ